MQEKSLAEPVDEDRMNEELAEAFKGMATWRNRLIIPELKKKGMEPPAVNDMQLDVIRDAMNKALKCEYCTVH